MRDEDSRSISVSRFPRRQLQLLGPALSYFCYDQRATRWNEGRVLDFLCRAPDLVSSLQCTQNFASKKLLVFSADRNSHAFAVSREGTCRASCHLTTFALLAPEPLGV